MMTFLFYVTNDGNYIQSKVLQMFTYVPLTYLKCKILSSRSTFSGAGLTFILLNLLNLIPNYSNLIFKTVCILEVHILK